MLLQSLFLVSCTSEACLITFAGVPATTAPAGTSCVTIAPAATIAPLPTRTPSKITAFAPINTSSSIITGDALGVQSHLPILRQPLHVHFYQL